MVLPPRAGKNFVMPFLTCERLPASSDGWKSAEYI